MANPTDDELKAALKAFDLQAVMPWPDDGPYAMGFARPGPDGSGDVIALKFVNGDLLKRKIGTITRTGGKITPSTEQP